MNNNYTDYNGLFTNQTLEEQQQRTQTFVQQSQNMHQQQQPQQENQFSQNSQPIDFAANYDNMSQHSQQDEHPSRFGSFVSNSSQFSSSEVNFNDINDAVSSIHSGILSPYSTGSSPDFFLSATNSNVDSQYSHDENGYDISMQPSNSMNNDILYPQLFVPVPMAESASNSTVTFNTNDNYHQIQQNLQQNLNPVAEADEDSVKRESPEQIDNNIPQTQQEHNLSSKIQSNASNTSLVSGASTTQSHAPNHVHSHIKDKSEVKLGRKVKSSHNLIEKKYRTNINSKIIELRNCVPALRILVAKNGNHRTRSTTMEVEETDDYYEGDGYSDDEEKLDGLKPAKKLNKATILAKATEYIKHLEKKCDFLFDENLQLKRFLENNGLNVDAVLGQNKNLYQNSVQSTPFNNSTSNSNSVSNASNLVSPVDPNYQSQQQQQQFSDNQSISNNLLMNNLGKMLGASTIDNLDQGSLF